MMKNPPRAARDRPRDHTTRDRRERTARAPSAGDVIVAASPKIAASVFVLLIRCEERRCYPRVAIA